MFFALFYNVMGIPIAAGVFAGIGIVLRPELAGIAMVLSSISVVSNSLLLRRFRPGKTNWVSKIAPIVMIVVFALLFAWFAKMSSGMAEGGKKMGAAPAKTVVQMEATKTGTVLKLGVTTSEQSAVTSGEKKIANNGDASHPAGKTTEAVSGALPATTSFLDRLPLLIRR